MKTKRNKSIGKPLTVGILVLGLGLGLPAFGGQGASKTNRAVPNAHYEMVPHVVLPESIQYTPSAKNLAHLASRSLNSSPGGVTSPFVATYTAFPSYQLPHGTPMKTVGQSVYPVSPQRLPQPLPESTTDAEDSVSDELTLTEPQTLENTEETSPILLAANYEEIIPAVPTADMSAAITQTGIFCSSQPKAPAAWSFSSPLFKAASVPMGNGGFINQTGLRGSAAQVGFSPVGGYGMPGMMDPPMMMGHGQGGPQYFTLPNGFAMMSLPSSHANCGPIRCRQTGQQWMLLPPGLMGAPMNAPAPQMAPPLPADPAAFMMMQQMQAMQPQPITAMTPYGIVVVGHRPAPMATPYGMNPMMNAGMNPMVNQYQAAYAMQVQQLQLQIQLLQQQNAQLMSKQVGEGENKDVHASGEPSVPLSINPQVAMQQQMLQQMPMLAYAPYGQLYAADANVAANPADPNAAAVNPMMMDPMMGNPMMMGINPMMCPPMMYNPMMMGQNPMMGHQMMGINPMMYNPMMMGMNPMMYGGNPYMMCGMNGNGGGFNQGGMSTSDMLMLMMLMKDNQPRRQGLFARIAARRAERQNAGQNDMFQQMMQAWCTPYMPMDAAMRMPARNAYPYGYFGAQVGPQETANYGGYHNLYMGNTTYPGLY